MRNGQTYRTVRRKRARYLIGLSDVIAASDCPREKRERVRERVVRTAISFPREPREAAFNLIPSSNARSRRGERVRSRAISQQKHQTMEESSRIGGAIDPTVVPQSHDKLQHKHESERAHTYPWIFMQNC